MQKVKETLLEYCNFRPETTYVLLLLARKKENTNQVESQKEKRAVRFLVQSEANIDLALEQFERTIRAYPDVIYRIYVSVNPRCLKKGLVAMQKRAIDLQQDLLNGNTEAYTTIQRLGSEWKSLLANKKCRADRRFLFDIDLPQTNENVEAVRDLIDAIPTNVHYVGNTNSGMCLVTDPFNVAEVKLTEATEVNSDGYLYLGIFNKRENYED